MALTFAKFFERFCPIGVLLVLGFILLCPTEVLSPAAVPPLAEVPLWAKLEEWAWDAVGLSLSMGGLLLAVLTLLQAMSALDGVKALIRAGAWQKVVRACLTSMYAWFGAAGATLLAIPLMVFSVRWSLMVTWAAITFAVLRFVVCLLWVGQLLRGLEDPSRLISPAQGPPPSPKLVKPLAFRLETMKETAERLEQIRTEAPTDPSAA